MKKERGNLENGDSDIILADLGEVPKSSTQKKNQTEITNSEIHYFDKLIRVASSIILNSNTNLAEVPKNTTNENQVEGTNCDKTIEILSDENSNIGKPIEKKTTTTDSSSCNALKLILLELAIQDAKEIEQISRIYYSLVEHKQFLTKLAEYVYEYSTLKGNYYRIILKVIVYPRVNTNWFDVYAPGVFHKCKHYMQIVAPLSGCLHISHFISRSLSEKFGLPKILPGDFIFCISKKIGDKWEEIRIIDGRLDAFLIAHFPIHKTEDDIILSIKTRTPLLEIAQSGSMFSSLEYMKDVVPVIVANNTNYSTKFPTTTS